MEIVYIGSLIALTVAIYAFLRGLRVIQKLEEQKWREQFKEAIQAIDKKQLLREPVRQ